MSLKSPLVLLATALIALQQPLLAACALIPPPNSASHELSPTLATPPQSPPRESTPTHNRGLLSACPPTPPQDSVPTYGTSFEWGPTPSNLPRIIPQDPAYRVFSQATRHLMAVAGSAPDAPFRTFKTRDGWVTLSLKAGVLGQEPRPAGSPQGPVTNREAVFYLYMLCYGWARTVDRRLQGSISTYYLSVAPVPKPLWEGFFMDPEQGPPPRD